MILLDTCVLLRLTDGAVLPHHLRHALEQDAWCVSALSAWEISIKHALGKLPLDVPPARWWPGVVANLGVTVLPFSDAQAIRAGGLPMLHTDPFDRAIIATALESNLPLATVDPLFDAYRGPCGLVLAGV